MKLYVILNNHGKYEKLYLKVSAGTRKELIKQLGCSKFVIKNHEFSINDIKAEVPKQEKSYNDHFLVLGFGLLGRSLVLPVTILDKIGDALGINNFGHIDHKKRKK